MGIHQTNVMGITARVVIIMIDAVTSAYLIHSTTRKIRGDLNDLLSPSRHDPGAGANQRGPADDERAGMAE